MKTIDSKIFRAVDPFHGTGAVDLPEPEGIARAWDWRKAQTGNCHPGASFPFGMVSACPYSGMYPTGYGVNDLSSEYAPKALLECNSMDGITHFHVSGTGNVKLFYNYFKVTPFSKDFRGDIKPQMRKLTKEYAEPGYFSGTNEEGDKFELTVSGNAAAHRYSEVSALFLDIAHGGLNIPERPEFKIKPDDFDFAASKNGIEGLSVMRGVKIFFCAICPGHDMSLLSNGALIKTTRSELEFYIGFSLASKELARKNAEEICRCGFEKTRSKTAEIWKEHLERIKVEGGSADEYEIFYSCLYHSLIKPCDFSEDGEASYYDFATIWDQYKTQLPLIYTVYPEHGKRIVKHILNVINKKGTFPNGLLLENSEDRFYKQASSLAVYTLYDAFIRGLVNVSLNDLLEAMLMNMQNAPFYDSFIKGRDIHSLSHILDFSGACACIEKISRLAGQMKLADEMQKLSDSWRKVYDTDTGLLLENHNYYEGTHWNYSFRLQHNMTERIESCGGKDKFIDLLETFFGYKDNCSGAFSRQIRDHRFEGLNNEPDMETPYAFAFAERHDRCVEVLRSTMKYQFAPGRGGLPGNDDSGGSSSWFVWNAIGLFPVTGQDISMLGSPLFNRVSIKQSDGEFVSQTLNNSVENIYLKSASINGMELNSPWLDTKSLSVGGRLEMTMSKEGKTL